MVSLKKVIKDKGRGMLMDGASRRIVVPLSGYVNLKATLECGQAFRWKRTEFPGDGFPVAYRGVVGNTALMVGQSKPVTGEIVVRWEGDADDDFIRSAIRDYFSDSDDVASIERELAGQDQVMAQAIPFSSGLRILKQDPWECLGSYVLSLNNSITNISRIVANLAQCYGEPVGMGEFSFPGSEAIACQEVAKLRQSKCGFRDKYLHDAAVKVAVGDINMASIRLLPTAQARQKLMTIAGVGPKVADCILLFGYHRLEVFPTDVWIARAVSQHYLGGKMVIPAEARLLGERIYGPLAGYAQAYLFYWMRNAG